MVMWEKKTAFTLIEVLITVAITALLAALAIPSFYGTIEQSRSNEAAANLNVIYTAEKIYALNNAGAYYPAAGANTSTGKVGAPANLATINTSLNTDIALPAYYAITINNTTVTVGGVTTFTFTAQAARGNTGAKTFTIDQTGAITSAGNYS